MSTLVVRHFDLLDFVKRSKELGMSELLAEYQGRKIEEAMEEAIAVSKEVVESKELATKQDLKAVESKLELKIKEVELKIEQARNQTIIWIGGFIIASCLISHFFK